MATFSIAVSDKYTDKQGNRTEKTEWINVQAFGKLAQIMGQYLTKGSQVFISGSLQTRKYTDAQGIERYVTEIRATSMQMLGSRTDGEQEFKRHTLVLSDNVTAFVEQIEPNKASSHFYRVTFKPSVIVPDVDVR